MENTAKILSSSTNGGARTAPVSRGYDIVHRVGIGAPAEKVFAALATIEGLESWWTPTSGNAALGGRLTFFGGKCEMEVTARDPGKLVAWRCTRGPDGWTGTEVTFELVSKPEQTFVVFKHAGWKEQTEFMHHCSTKWATFLTSLIDAVERGEGRPAPRDQKIHVGD